MSNYCANFHCDNMTFGGRIRCGNCRRQDMNLCCDCDRPTTRRALYCDDCRMNHRETMLKAFFYNRKGAMPECVMCGQELPKRKCVVCPDSECKRIYLNLGQIVRRGKRHITN